jgi:hypothetical protein
MTITNEALLQKAVLTTDDFGGAGEAPLSIEQVDRFIVLLAAEQAMLPDVRTVTSRASKWQESIMDFSGRIAHPGVEATRLVEGDRSKPGTGVIEISTVLLRGEVPVSDEAMEDMAARGNFADDLTTGIASRFGFDVEELLLNGSLAANADLNDQTAYMRLQDGWLAQALDASAADNIAGGISFVYDAVGDAQDYQEIFKQLLVGLPDRFKRNIESDGRYWAPKRLEEKYRDLLSARGTALGDLSLTGANELKYQAVRIVGVPSMFIKAGSPDTSHILFTNRNNLYAGYRRAITFETFRDPREGATSWVITARVDSELAVPQAASVAKNVNVEP